MVRLGSSLSDSGGVFPFIEKFQSDPDLIIYENPGFAECIGELSDKERLILPDLTRLAVHCARLHNSNTLDSYNALSHDDFLKKPEVSEVVLSAHEVIQRIAKTMEDTEQGEYWKLLFKDFPKITQPDSRSEIAWAKLYMNGNPKLVVKIGFLHDYNYAEGIRDETRRDIICYVGFKLGRDNLSSEILDLFGEFFEIKERPRIVVLSEITGLLSASQAHRAFVTGFPPAGSNHVVNFGVEGSVVIRIYSDQSAPKAVETIQAGRVFFDPGFWIENGLDPNSLQRDFVQGQYYELISHELAEAFGTLRYSGKDRATQECAYSAAGFCVMKQAVKSGNMLEKDLMFAMVYFVSRIVNTLIVNKGGPYLPGYALMYRKLLDDQAMSFNESYQVVNIDWGVFDKVMESIARELIGNLSLNELPISANLNQHVLFGVNDPHIVFARKRLLSKS